MSAHPLIDPTTQFDNIPYDWRVLWCAGCGYSVTWTMADYETYLWPEWSALQHDACAHDCLAARDAPQVVDKSVGHAPQPASRGDEIPACAEHVRSHDGDGKPLHYCEICYQDMPEDQ